MALTAATNGWSADGGLNAARYTASKAYGFSVSSTSWYMVNQTSATQIVILRTTDSGDTFTTFATIATTARPSTKGATQFVSMLPNAAMTVAHLVYTTANAIVYRQINLGNGAVTAEEDVAGATGQVTSLDMSISDADSVLVGFMANVGTTHVMRVSQRSTAAVWSKTLYTVTLEAATKVPYLYSDIAIEWYKTVSSNVRRFTVMTAHAITPIDKGIRHFHCSVNEAATGATFSSQLAGIYTFTDMGAIFPGTNTDDGTFINTSWRNGQVFSMNANTQCFGYSWVNWNAQGLIAGERDAAGRIKVTTFGANAAADILQVGYVETTPAISEGNDVNSLRFYNNGSIYTRSITFGYDIDGMPVLNILHGVSGGTGSGGGSASYMSNTVHFNDPASASFSVTTIPYGQFIWTVYGPMLPMANNRASTVTWHTVANLGVSNGQFTVLAYCRANEPKLAAYAYTQLATVSPQTGQTLASSTPTIAVTQVTQAAINWSRRRILRVQASTDAGFTSGLYTYTFPAYAKTDSFTGVWAGSPIPSRTNFIRFAVFDALGNIGKNIAGVSGWEVVSGVVITHPAKAAALLPSYTDETSRPYSDPFGNGYTEVPVSWSLSDAWAPDTQSAYRVIVYSSSMAPVYDTGKVVSANKSAIARIPLANSNGTAYYSVQLWDQYDQAAPITGNDQYGKMFTYAPPVINSIVLDQVDGSGNVNSTNPTYRINYTNSLYAAKRVEWQISKGGVVLSSGFQPIAAGVASPVTFTASGILLSNYTDYTVTVAIVDAKDLKGILSKAFHTQWVPPAGPAITVDTSLYNTENQSKITVSWNNAAQDVDFVSWNLFRKVDEIDPDTQVVVREGSLEEISYVYDNQGNYTYADYYAPSGYKVSYLVRQTVMRLGALMTSENSNMVSVFPRTDGYWLIDPTPEDPLFGSFKLSIVTSDSYSEKYESSMMHIIGRGNREDRGDELGIEGSLTAQLRNTGGTTARQKKLRLEYIRREARNLFLRTPFGDTWFVSVGDIQIDRIAGVGLSEFCDVTIPYTEVYYG